MDIPGGHAKRASELGEGDSGAEREFSAGCDSAILLLTWHVLLWLVFIQYNSWAYILEVACHFTSKQTSPYK